jgi:signal transduction histidine kinase
VSIRDDGAGMPSDRLEQAAAAGRLGVAQSMVGRVRDLGGTTEITSQPGAGTEVEFRVPRRPSSA